MASIGRMSSLILAMSFSSHRLTPCGLSHTVPLILVAPVASNAPNHSRMTGRGLSAAVPLFTYQHSAGHSSTISLSPIDVARTHQSSVWWICRQFELVSIPNLRGAVQRLPYMGGLMRERNECARPRASEIVCNDNRQERNWWQWSLLGAAEEGGS